MILKTVHESVSLASSPFKAYGAIRDWEGAFFCVSTDPTLPVGIAPANVTDPDSHQMLIWPERIYYQWKGCAFKKSETIEFFMFV